MSQIIGKDILDLTRSDLEDSLLLQQVNCQNEMDAGVAMTIDKLSRELFEISTIKMYHYAWNDLTHNGDLQRIKHIKKLYDTTNGPCYWLDYCFGFSFSQWNCGSDGKHYTNDGRLIQNIKSICNETIGNSQEKYKTIYIPYKIGCGLGGGNWNYVYDHIKDIPNLVILKRKDDK